MLIIWHWTNSKGLPKQQQMGILQYERIGTPDSNVSGAERSHPEQCGYDTHWRLKFDQSSYDWLSGFQISSILNTQRSLPDSKLEYGEKQGPSKWDPVLWSEVKTSATHRNQRANQKNLKTCSCSYLGSRLTPQTLNSSTFLWDCPFKNQIRQH
jgi:hypothetical protein